MGNSLQSEFTKRCQRVKELEAELNSAVDKATVPTQTEQAESTIDKEQILKDYLKGVLSKKQSAIVMDGAGVGIKTPNNRPTTLAQASALAQEILKK